MQVPFDETAQLIFDRITFDDHTEKQVKFLHALFTDNCTFMLCDENYRANFSSFVSKKLGDNKYYNYTYQHVSELCPIRSKFKRIFKKLLETNPKYLESVKNYYQEDYDLINNVEFYGAR